VTYLVSLMAWLSLVPEVQYSHERATLTEVNYAMMDVLQGSDSRLRLHYLNVPVLVRASLGPVYIEAGPQASLLLGGRQTGTFTSSGWNFVARTRPLDQPVADSHRRFDVGPCVGIGAKLPAGLGVSVRAYRGLTTLNQERHPYDGARRCKPRSPTNCLHGSRAVSCNAVLLLAGLHRCEPRRWRLSDQAERRA
jgi:hypothetical protein